MRSIVFLISLFLTASFYAEGQTSKPMSLLPNPKAFVKPAGVEKEKISPAESNKANRSSKQTQPQTYTRPDAKKRFNRYAKSIFGPTALAKTVFSAGYSTWRNSPEEWGDDWEGFSRRLASGMGKSAIKQTTIYALDEAFKLDSAFYRSQKKDFGSRLGNALVSPFTARKPNGKRVFGFPRLVGTYASSIIAAEAWFPRRYNYKDGLRSGTISLGVTAAFNVFKEFIRK